MRTALIDDYLAQLTRSLGRVREPVDDAELLRLYRAQDYNGMVGFVKRSMNIGCRMKLGLVNKGGLSSAAWIERPDPVPRAGTADFRNMLAVMFVQKSFIAEASFEALVYAMAHEGGHVVLDSIDHPLRKKEAAVDLTCMLMGFRDFCVTGCQYVLEEPPQLSPILQSVTDAMAAVFGEVAEKETPPKMLLGYLSRDEAIYAAKRMST